MCIKIICGYGKYVSYVNIKFFIFHTKNILLVIFKPNFVVYIFFFKNVFIYFIYVITCAFLLVKNISILFFLILQNVSSESKSNIKESENNTQSYK